MLLFAALASIVFGAVAKDTTSERWLYGLKVFAEFMIICLVLGWLLFLIPQPAFHLMALTETEALVLRTYNLAEADKIVVCLSRSHGLIRGVAKGCRKLKNRFG